MEYKSLFSIGCSKMKVEKRVDTNLAIKYQTERTLTSSEAKDAYGTVSFWDV